MTRWGILSTARIAEKLIGGARVSSDASIVAVGSRDLARAREFADEHGIPEAFGSYEELLGVAGRRRDLHPAAELDARRVVDQGPRGRQARACARSRWRARREEVERAFDVAERVDRVLMEAFMWRFHVQTEELVRAAAHDRRAAGHPRGLRLQPAVDGERPLGPVAGRRGADGRRLLLRLARCGSWPASRSASPASRCCTTASTPASAACCASRATCSGSSTAAWTSIAATSSRSSAPRARSTSPFPWQTPLGAGFTITRDGEPEQVTPETVDPYGRELDEMGRAIAGGDPPRLGRADAVGQARTIEALYRAADTGTSVSL